MSKCWLKYIAISVSRVRNHRNKNNNSKTCGHQSWCETALSWAWVAGKKLSRVTLAPPCGTDTLWLQLNPGKIKIRTTLDRIDVCHVEVGGSFGESAAWYKHAQIFGQVVEEHLKRRMETGKSWLCVNVCCVHKFLCAICISVKTSVCKCVCM